MNPGHCVTNFQHLEVTSTVKAAWTYMHKTDAQAGAAMIRRDNPGAVVRVVRRMVRVEGATIALWLAVIH